MVQDLIPFFDLSSIYQKWLLFALCVGVGLSFKRSLRFFIRQVFQIISRIFFKQKSEIFHSFQTPLTYFSLFFIYLVCVYMIQPNGAGFSWVIKMIHMGIGVSGLFIIRPVLHILIGRIEKNFQTDPLYKQFFELSKKTASILVFVVGLLMIVQNLGYDVTALIAGLGIGGVAVALAAKDTLSNIFGSIIILFDKPFIVGDWIQFEGTEGTVQSIGFRSTQIKTFYDSVVSIPNSILSNTKIDNLGKRKARRARFNLGLVYSTPPEKITQFIEEIKNIILKHPKTKKDYFQVSFSGYGDSSLNIFVNLFLQVSDWNEELSAKQNIFLEILKSARKTGVEFAFPSQSLYIQNLTNANHS